MNKGARLPSPGGYNQAYDQSFNLALDALAQSDIDEICYRSGAKRLDDDSVILPFLRDDVIVNIARRTVTSVNHISAITDQLIVLHYLVTATGAPLSGKLISFQELPGGMVYHPTFCRRAIAPLVNRFGESPGELIAAAAGFGGEPVSLGDAAIVMQALPRVALTWVLWRGDADFPPEGAVLFDSAITDYLPIEDIAVLCQSVSLKLCGK